VAAFTTISHTRIRAIVAKLTDPALRRIRSVVPLVTQAARAMGVQPSQPYEKPSAPAPS
jgi:hypothetical protein